MEENKKDFKVFSYTIQDKNSIGSWTHWTENLKMIIKKGDITLELEGEEVQDIVKSLPRTFGGKY